jgi:hypothetical protein
MAESDRKPWWQKLLEYAHETGGMWATLLVYVVIAVVSVILDQATVQSESSRLSWETMTALKATLQGFIGIRAFMDGSAAWTAIRRKQKRGEPTTLDAP